MTSKKFNQIVDEAVRETQEWEDTRFDRKPKQKRKLSLLRWLTKKTVYTAQTV